MKILFLCTYYHRAMIFKDMKESLKKLRNNIIVFNAVAYKTKIDEKYKKIMTNEIIHVECFFKWDRFVYFYKQKKILKSLISTVRLSEIQLIHSQTLFNGGYVCYLLNKNIGIPYIISVRNTDMNIFLKLPYFRYIADKIIKNAVGVQFLSEPYKKKYMKNYCNDFQKKMMEQKSVVIRNGLEEFWIKNKAKKTKKLSSKTIKILCVGKIDKNKNIETTIGAVEKLIRQGYEIKLTVVGQIINKKITNILNKKKFVQLIDFLSKEELIEIYKENDIFVMPSINETFGRVYAEAITQGLPVIYSKDQGFDGIFEDGYVGFSVPSMDEEYIAKKILEIVDNYEVFSNRCIENTEKFDWNNISKELDEFYKNSIKRGEKNESRIINIS